MYLTKRPADLLAIGPRLRLDPAFSRRCASCATHATSSSAATARTATGTGRRFESGNSGCRSFGRCPDTSGSCSFGTRTSSWIPTARSAGFASGSRSSSRCARSRVSGSRRAVREGARGARSGATRSPRTASATGGTHLARVAGQLAQHGPITRRAHRVRLRARRGLVVTPRRRATRSDAQPTWRSTPPSIAEADGTHDPAVDFCRGAKSRSSRSV